MSGRIEQERKDYYAILESTQKGGLEITLWLEWFLECMGRAVDSAEETLASVLFKSRVWSHANQFSLNGRQRLVLTRLLDDFSGKLTSSKYAKLAKVSQDTAIRYIRGLVACGILKQGEGGGRNTAYEIATV